MTTRGRRSALHLTLTHDDWQTAGMVGLQERPNPRRGCSKYG